MLPQQKAVVRGNDQHRVLPQIVTVHGVQQTAQIGVAHGEQSAVLVAAVCLGAERLRDPRVVRPVEPGAVVVIGVQRLVALLGEKRLMGVKGLQMEQPVVRVAVDLQEILGQLKHLGQGLLLLAGEIGAVDGVLAAGLSQVGRDDRVLHPGLPGVPLLAAHALPGVIAGMVSSAAVLPVVLVVGYEVGVDAVLLQDLGHGIVVGLNGSPAPVEEIVPSGMQLPAGRHTGEGAGVAAVKTDRVPGKTLKIGRDGPVAAVGGETVAVQRVEQQ